MKADWRPRRWPLGIQLVLSFTLITVMAIGGGGMLMVHRLQQGLMADQSAKALAQARAAAELAQQNRFSARPEDLPLALYTFHLQTGARPLVLDGNGVVTADSWIPSPLRGQKLTHPEVDQGLAGDEATGYRQLDSGEWVLYAVVPLEIDGRQAGAVLVSSNLTDLEANLRNLKHQLLLVLTAAGIMTVLVGVALARYLAKPLENLYRAASAMGEGDLTARVKPEGSREVVELVQRFNMMAEQLAQLDQQRRTFVAAASHELRTPVASIRALADALLADTSGDVSIYKEYLGDIVSESERAQHLMDRLLELARLEERKADPQDASSPTTAVNLRNVCLDVIDSLRNVAQSHQVQLELMAPDPIWTWTETLLVETVVINLAENALKYTPSGGRVQISVSARQGEAWIQVIDTGPGIPADHLPHLFERFYRVDKSRSRATGGVGLGLSIAAEAARQQGGRLEVESTVGQGTCFSLILPEAQRPDSP